MNLPNSSAEGLTRQQKVYTMVGVLLGLLLAALDQTIVATAGPYIQRDLDIAPSLYVWLTTAYLVASTVLVPVYGKLSDLYGRKNILLVGVSVFLLGSLACGLSSSPMALILARAVQGIGSASLFTTAFAVVADLFPPAERGKYQGLFGSVFGFSSVVGPLVGGFITDALSWHWAFLINLPVGGFALFLIITRMPPLKHNQTRAPVDVLGAVALVAAIVPLLLALSLGKTKSAAARPGYFWDSWQILGLFFASAVGFFLFILQERRAKDPILDFSLFRNRTFGVGSLAAFLAGASFLASVVYLPLFMVNVVGLSATRSGLTTTPLTLGVVASSTLSGQLVSRVGRYKIFILSSMVLLVFAFSIMSFTLTPESTQLELTWKMVLVGLGLGPAIPLFTLAIQNAVSTHRIGVATSTATFARQMGATVGLALVGTVFAGALFSGTQQHTKPVLEKLPPAIQEKLAAQVTEAAPPPTEEGGEVSAFGTEEIKKEISADFTQQRQLLEAALLRKDPEARATLLADPALPENVRKILSDHPDAPEDVSLKAALLSVEQAEKRAISAIDALERAMKEAFTGAISQIYQLCILLAILAFLVTLFLPELPLRSGSAPVALSE